MKVSAIIVGLTIKNPNYYDKRENADVLVLSDGTEISFDGEENFGPNDCYNYADWSALEDTGFFEDKTITAKNLKLEPVNPYGFRINGYFVPCYSCQNGYYDNTVSITAIKHGKVIATINCIGR